MATIGEQLTTNKSDGNFSLDAIDIDDTGFLVHPTLNQISDINSMQVGDCIPCRYTATTSGVAGYFSELGTCIANEIPITGTATPDGLFYLIKTDKGTLIADRVIQTNISWDVLNTAKFIEGKPITLEVKNILIRSLSGGCAFTDANGNKSLTDCGKGAWPINNEWDKYIVNSDLKEKITKGDDNIWHYKYNLQCHCKETPITGTWGDSKGNLASANNGCRILRGNITRNTWSNVDFVSSSDIRSEFGFRPVLNYVESDIASEVIH